MEGVGGIMMYLKIAWRNLLRQKLYSFINIGGLALGLCVCMLIMLYIAHEYSFDRFHVNAKRTFAVDERAKIGGNNIQFANTNYVTGPLTKQSDPAVEDYTRIYTTDNNIIIENPLVPDAKFSERKVLFTDANFFHFFSFRLLSGDAGHALSSPSSVVITEDMARKYFGDQNPVGKTLKIARFNSPFIVTGVAANAPSNSSINFDFLVPSGVLNMNKALLAGQFVGNGDFKTYLRLTNSTDTATVQRSMTELLHKDKNSIGGKFYLTALPDIHFKNNYGDNANIKYLKIFPLVAALILLLALVNYMSLSTARATLRAKEVGVRKVSGASRSAIALQFYVESALFAVLSFILAYALCYSLKGPFFHVLQLKLDTSFLYSTPVIIIMIILLVLTIVVAGSYPSLVLSAFKPVVTLKGKMSKQSGGVAVRKVFTVLQFAIAVGLIICGIIIDRQLYYFRHKDTGLNRENVVMIGIGPTFGNQYQSFKKDVQSIAGISQVATGHDIMYRSSDAIFTVDDATKQSTVIFVHAVDQNFIPMLNIKWKYPPLSLSTLALPGKIVLNEEMVEKLRLRGNPVGQIVHADKNYEVAAVVKNFDSGSNFFVTADTASKWGNTGGYLYAKINPHVNTPSIMDAIKKDYQKYDNQTPFDFTFLDDVYNQQYKAEDRLASIFSIFTVITITLAAMGLFGLAAFTIEQRTKEIGIRKILGARIAAITSLLSMDFLKLILLSIVIASPVAWWSMQKWLQNFTDRISIQWWMFALAGFMAVFVAVITIGYHAIRAAVVNPVKGLRSE